MGRGRVRRGQRAIAKRQTTTETETIFKTVVVDGQSNVIADQKADRLTLDEGANIVLTTNDTTDNITISGYDT